MCVWSRHFPEFGVSLNVYTGTITPDALMRFIDGLEPVAWTRWVNYLDPALDLSGLDIAHIPGFKSALAEKLRELHGETHVRSALVTASPENELALDFWPSYVGRDVRYPAEPVAYRTLDAACEGLELPEGACPALGEAVREPPSRTAPPAGRRC